MRLSRPTNLVFLISVGLLILSVLVRFGGMSIPVVNGNVYEVLLAGFVLLVLGNLLRGL